MQHFGYGRSLFTLIFKQINLSLFQMEYIFSYITLLILSIQLINRNLKKKFIIIKLHICIRLLILKMYSKQAQYFWPMLYLMTFLLQPFEVINFSNLVCFTTYLSHFSISYRLSIPYDVFIYKADKIYSLKYFYAHSVAANEIFRLYTYTPKMKLRFLSMTPLCLKGNHQRN